MAGSGAQLAATAHSSTTGCNCVRSKTCRRHAQGNEAGGWPTAPRSAPTAHTWKARALPACTPPLMMLKEGTCGGKPWKKRSTDEIRRELGSHQGLVGGQRQGKTAPWPPTL